MAKDTKCDISKFFSKSKRAKFGRVSLFFFYFLGSRADLHVGEILIFSAWVSCKLDTSKESDRVSSLKCKLILDEVNNVFFDQFDI